MHTLLKQKYTHLLSLFFLLGCFGCESEDSTDPSNSTPTTGGNMMSADGGTNTPSAGGMVNTGGEMGEEVTNEENRGGEAEVTGGTEGTEMMGGDVYIEVPEEDGDMLPTDLGEDGQGAHAFTMRNIEGEMIDLRVYRNKVMLIVNVASFCGYTRQYEGLQTLYDEYKDQGLVILGFPANNFGNQEPGSEEDIQEFCSSTYGVNFPMFTKISVKGEDIHPLYTYLTEASGRDVSWNFNKFLVDGEGNFTEHYLSGTEPDSMELKSAIEALLPAP